MNTQRHGPRDIHDELSRRDLLRLAGVGLSGLGLAAIAGCGTDDGNGSPTSTPGTVVDPPPETTTIRLARNTFTPRWAPLYLAAEFLPAEGFTDVQYIDVPPGSGTTGGDFQQIASGEVDITLHLTTSVIVAADRGDPFVILAGVHGSAFELFGSDRVQSLRDLKGKRIWVLKRDDPSDPSYSGMAALLAYVGIDVRSEVEFVEVSIAESFAQIQAGTIDAWIATRPNSTALRKLGIGHVVIDGTVDPPWSQHVGNFATANREFVEKHPAATKRALRAILKAADVCARDPQRAARYVVDRGLARLALAGGGEAQLSYEQVLDIITGASYAAWREFNPEDTVRFYALRLREAGLVKSTPEALIARATNWRYLDEIKRELGVA